MVFTVTSDEDILTIKLRTKQEKSPKLRKPRRDIRLPTSDFRLPTSDFRLQTSDFRLPTSDFRLPTSDFRLPTSDFRLQTSDFRLPTSDFRLPTSDFRLQTSDFRLGLISADLRVVVVINMKHVEKYNRVISEQSVAKPNEAERLSKNKKRKKRS